FRLLKKMSGHAVGDQRDVDSVLLQLPRGEPRALKVRTSLISKDGDLFSLLDRRANHAERRAIAGGGQRAGVAMSEHRCAAAEELGAEATDAVVRFEIFAKNSLRF